MKLYLHNYTMTPAVVRQITTENEKAIIKQLHISEKGIHTPAIGLLKVGMLYPTPIGNMYIKTIESGCITF
jgi:hypothetical protein